MFKGLSLSAKLYLGFACIIAIAAALGAFAFTRLKAIGESSTVITKDCLPGIVAVNRLNALAKDNMRWTVAAFLADSPAEIQVESDKIKENVAKSEKTFQEYEASVFSAEDRRLFEAARAAVEDFRNMRNHVIELCLAGKKQEAEDALKQKLRPAYNKYETAILDLVEYNTGRSEKESASIASSIASAITGIVAGLLLAVALGAAIGIFLSRSISNALNLVITSLSSGSEQVASASSQVSQSSQSMAEGASEQASSLEETSASLEEMSSMTKQNSDNARQANAMASETRSAVEKSREAMTRMGDAITRIKGSSDQTAKIIKTIDEIAFQTNLLALNAAVEAARAGDAGKGFAVVAEEVRNLAQRSAEAAKSTASLIEESQQNANNGVAVSGEVAGILSGIVESVQKLTQLIGEVSAASDEQSKGIEQIGTAVTEMDKLTQANAANAEESASASEELAAQAKELGEMVQVLVGIVQGASGTAAAGSAHASPRPAARRAFAAPSRAPGKAAKAAAHGGFPAGKPDKASAKAAGADWSAAGKAHANGHGHAQAPRSARPEQVIPMDDSELKDF